MNSKKLLENTLKGQHSLALKPYFLVPIKNQVNMSFKIEVTFSSINHQGHRYLQLAPNASAKKIIMSVSQAASAEANISENSIFPNYQDH